jgi:Autotransporter beta-domain
MKRIITTAFLAAAFLGIALPVTANDLEERCDVDRNSEFPAPNPYLCPTALEFGGQAALLRDMLLSRHHGAGPGETGVTASTSGTDSPYTGMVTGGAQVTGGNFSGDFQALVLGADRTLSGGTFVGLMLQFGRSEVTAPGSPRVTRREILIGPYIGSDLGNGFFLDGYLLFGQPDYTVAGVPSRGDSVTGAITLSKAVQGNTLDYLLFASVSAKREEPAAANRIDATILTLGGSLRSEDRRFATGWRQNYARLELDIGNYSDNLGSGTINYVAPRLAIGTDIAFDNNATLNLSANASMASDQTRILAVRASYNLRF